MYRKAEGEKRNRRSRLHTGPGLAAYELELRNPTVIMVNIKTLNRTSERKVDFLCSRLRVMAIGCSEEKKKQGNFLEK